MRAFIILILLSINVEAKWLVFDGIFYDANLSSFKKVNDRMNVAFGYPNSSKTVTYAKPKAHPDGVRVAIYLNEACEPHLSSEEVDSLIDQLPEDWEPNE